MSDRSERFAAVLEKSGVSICLNVLTDRVVVAVLADLTGRRGFRQAWDAVDNEVRQELVEELREVVQDAIREAADLAAKEKA